MYIANSRETTKFISKEVQLSTKNGEKMELYKMLNQNQRREKESGRQKTKQKNDDEQETVIKYGIC